MTKVKKRVRTKAQQKAVISPITIGLVVALALIVVGSLIALGYQQSGAGSGPVDLSQFPAKGDINAPVTMIEYSDYG